MGRARLWSSRYILTGVREKCMSRNPVMRHLRSQGTMGGERFTGGDEV